MKKQIYYCDHCGKEVSADYAEVGIDCCSVQDDFDLCEDCYAILSDMVDRFLQGKKFEEVDDETESD